MTTDNQYHRLGGKLPDLSTAEIKNLEVVRLHLMIDDLRARLLEAERERDEALGLLGKSLEDLREHTSTVEDGW